VRSGLTGIHVVLQAGGRGERLRNGERLPKPLFQVNGVPMIERLVRQTVDAGARAITVITGFGGEEVELAVRSILGLPPDLALEFIHESSPRGNAGSLALVRRDLPCLFCFADLVTDLNFGRLAAIHKERGGAVTLASHYETVQVRLGELKADGDVVLAYREKPTYRVLIASGIAIFEPVVLSLVPLDQPSGLSHVAQAAIDRGLRVTHWLHESQWIDVNTREELAAAGRLVANMSAA
jgi:NDP-sugar pyrophosphorylase family protein